MRRNEKILPASEAPLEVLKHMMEITNAVGAINGRVHVVKIQRRVPVSVQGEPGLVQNCARKQNSREVHPRWRCAIRLKCDLLSGEQTTASGIKVGTPDPPNANPGGQPLPRGLAAPISNDGEFPFEPLPPLIILMVEQFYG